MLGRGCKTYRFRKAATPELQESPRRSGLTRKLCDLCQQLSDAMIAARPASRRQPSAAGRADHVAADAAIERLRSAASGQEQPASGLRWAKMASGQCPRRRSEDFDACGAAYLELCDQSFGNGHRLSTVHD